MEKKRTRSFRCPDKLWEFVEDMANAENKKPTDIVIDAVSSHVGDLIRKDRQLSNQQITSIMMKLDKLQKELNSVSETVGERSNE
jgi:uncharacterized protein (DUF1778 family)